MEQINFYLAVYWYFKMLKMSYFVVILYNNLIDVILNTFLMSCKQILKFSSFYLGIVITLILVTIALIHITFQNIKIKPTQQNSAE